MKRSGSMKSRDNTAFLYERISRDDNLEGDSYSVANQKKLLTKVANTYASLLMNSGTKAAVSSFVRPLFLKRIEESHIGISFLILELVFFSMFV